MADLDDFFAKKDKKKSKKPKFLTAEELVKNLEETSKREVVKPKKPETVPVIAAAPTTEVGAETEEKVVVEVSNGCKMQSKDTLAKTSGRNISSSITKTIFQHTECDTKHISDMKRQCDVHSSQDTYNLFFFVGVKATLIFCMSIRNNLRTRQDNVTSTRELVRNTLIFYAEMIRYVRPQLW